MNARFTFQHTTVPDKVLKRLKILEKPCYQLICRWLHVLVHDIVPRPNHPVEFESIILRIQSTISLGLQPTLILNDLSSKLDATCEVLTNLWLCCHIDLTLNAIGCLGFLNAVMTPNHGFEICVTPLNNLHEIVHGFLLKIERSVRVVVFNSLQCFACQNILQMIWYNGELCPTRAARNIVRPFGSILLKSRYHGNITFNFNWICFMPQLAIGIHTPKLNCAFMNELTRFVSLRIKLIGLLKVALF